MTVCHLCFFPRPSPAGRPADLLVRPSRIGVLRGGRVCGVTRRCGSRSAERVHVVQHCLRCANDYGFTTILLLLLYEPHRACADARAHAARKTDE